MTTNERPQFARFIIQFAYSLLDSSYSLLGRTAQVRHSATLTPAREVCTLHNIVRLIKDLLAQTQIQWLARRTRRRSQGRSETQDSTSHRTPERHNKTKSSQVRSTRRRHASRNRTSRTLTLIHQLHTTQETRARVHSIRRKLTTMLAENQG